MVKPQKGLELSELNDLYPTPFVPKICVLKNSIFLVECPFELGLSQRELTSKRLSSSSNANGQNRIWVEPEN